MKFKGREIPPIPQAEKIWLDKIRKESARSGELRNIAYAVMNQTLRGANLTQKDGVALKALSSERDNSQVGPITIYSNGLDQGNIIELAIHSKKLADALRMDASMTEAWLSHLQEHIAHRAKPKTSEQYPRVGIRSDDELKAILDTWDVLVAERRWLTDASEETPSDVLRRLGFEDVRTDTGWAYFQIEGHNLLVRGEKDGFVLSADSELVQLLQGAVSDLSLESTIGKGSLPGLRIANEEWLQVALLALGPLIGKCSRSAIEESFQSELLALSETEKSGLIKQRVGQDVFRRALRVFWDDCCAVSGLVMPTILKASHIKPWSACETGSERLDVFNGLLLSPVFDALFNDGWITFGKDGALLCSQSLDAESKRLLLGDRAWRLSKLTNAHQPYLEYHRTRIFENKICHPRATFSP